MVQKAWICYRQRNKKIQVCEPFYVSIKHQARNFIKNETLAQVFSYEFWEFFQSAN